MACRRDDIGHSTIGMLAVPRSTVAAAAAGVGCGSRRTGVGAVVRAGLRGGVASTAGGVAGVGACDTAGEGAAGVATLAVAGAGGKLAGCPVAAAALCTVDSDVG
jgi:hypothetical protein